MSDDLGFATPVLRRDLTALRVALKSLAVGEVATATFQNAEYGRFAVSGQVRRDLTDSAFKVGWFDVTTGKGTEPVPDLQIIATASADDDNGSSGPPSAEDDALRRVVATLEVGDVVTAGFEFEGCGAFSIAGGIRRDGSGTRWIIAGHHLSRGGVPAPRLRQLVVTRKAAPVADERFDLFGD